VARIILFDIDLTLIATGGAGRLAMNDVFQRLTGKPNPTEGVTFEGRTDHAILMEVIARHHLGDGRLMDVYREVAGAYLEELERKMAVSNGRVLPGVVELLDALRREPVAVGLATGNMRRGAQIKLGHYGLWERFDGGGFGDETPVRAEVVRQAIEEVARLAGIDPDPQDAVVIGDTPLDIEAAHLAGAQALGVATGSYSSESLLEHGAQAAVSDLSETERVVEILLA
jgi:phosphoglycolate phosphatase